MKALALAGAAALALMTAPAFASTQALDFTWADGVGVSYAGGTVSGTGNFAKDMTFSLDPTDGVWDVAISLTLATVGSQTSHVPSSESLALYEGAVGSGTLVEKVSFTGNTLDLEVDNLAAGDYYFAYAGTASGLVSYGASVMAVDPAAAPEASTWTMLGLGFAGVGFVAVRRRKDSRYAL
jgi:hypothetical protein